VVPPGTETGPAWVTIAGVNAPSQNFTINTSAQITDSLGRSSSYTSVMLGGTWLGSDAQGSGCSRCTVRGTIHNDYDSVGRLTATTDELLHVTNLAYDAVRELIFSHRPKPGVVTAGAGHVAEAPLPVPKGNGSLCVIEAPGNLECPVNVPSAITPRQLSATSATLAIPSVRAYFVASY
jgi:YD repeat-containing protein